jgi:beta-lactamase class A
VWNYFIDKGLTPSATAGIMGNISVESGFDPQNIQDPAGRSKNPDDAGSGGWGLIQFTPGSYVFSVWAPAAHVQATRDNVYLLSTQLDIVWGYMKYSSGAGGSMLDEFKSRSTSVHSAADAFEDLVENAGIPNMTDRYAAADAAMSKYGQGSAPQQPGGGTAPNAPQRVDGTCTCPAGLQQLTTGDISEILSGLADKNGGKTSVSVAAADGSTQGNANGNVQMPTRSSYKIYTAYATLRAIEAGKISWSTVVRGPNWRGTVKDTMEQMIVLSNNDAAEALRLNNTIGSPAKVTNLLQNEVGLSSNTIMGSVSASDPWGSNSLSNSNDYVKFLLLLQKKKLPGVSQDSSYDTLLGYMKRATTDGKSARDGIAAGVGGGVDVADKPGWAPAGSDQASNDVGIVYLPNKPYVVAILTDKPDQWSGVAAIAKGVNQAMGGSDAGTTGDTGCAGGTVGNGDLSSTVKAYAWSTYHAAPFIKKRPDYATAVQKAQDAGIYVGGLSYPGIDCGGFVTLAMIDSGFEPKYNYSGKGGNTISQEAWLKANWQRIHPSSTADLQPGDVAINSDHTYIYVGKISGFQSNVASASLDSRAPMAGHEAPADPAFNWYRKQ